MNCAHFFFFFLELVFILSAIATDMSTKIQMFIFEGNPAKHQNPFQVYGLHQEMNNLHLYPAPADDVPANVAGLFIKSMYGIGRK